MYVESFILTVDPPEIQGGCVVLGEVHEGVFTVSSFPGSIETGALLEIAVDEDDDPGSYEVEILIEYSRIDNEPQTLVGDPFTIEVVEPSADWWGPRLLVPQPLAIKLTFWDEFEGFLVVRINGEEHAEKAMRVYFQHVPDHFGPADAP